jgi:hypothetical protein
MNRRALILAGFVTLPAAVLSQSTGAQRWRAPRRRQGGLTASRVRTRVVTRTFTSVVSITIPNTPAAPASPYPSTIQVGGFNQGRILKVQATLIGLSHTRPLNLDILLVGPGNKGVILMSDVGEFEPITGITLTFDQDAPGVPIAPLTSGVFQPLNDGSPLDGFPAPAPSVTGHSLTVFNNRNPNGAWKLFVFEDFGGSDGGSLGGWALRIRARERVPRQRRQRQRPARRPKP